MRSKRTPPEADSLELLIDPVCNMFGGVIFIVILLAILARGVGVASSGERERIRDEQTALRSAAVDAMEQAVEETARSTSTKTDDFAQRESLAKTLRLDSDAARARLADDKALLERLRGKERALGSVLAEAKSRRAALLQAQKDLDDLLRQEQASKTAVARLPVMRATSKIPIHIALSGGQAYVIYENDGRGGYIANNRDVDVNRDGDVDTVHFRPGGGFEPGGTFENDARWKELIGRLNTDRHFLYLMVYPDSFSTFRSVMSASLRAGLEYDIILMQNDEIIRLHPGKDFRTQ